MADICMILSFIECYGFNDENGALLQTSNKDTYMEILKNCSVYVPMVDTGPLGICCTFSLN